LLDRLTHHVHILEVRRELPARTKQASIAAHTTRQVVGPDDSNLKKHYGSARIAAPTIIARCARAPSSPAPTARAAARIWGLTAQAHPAIMLQRIVAMPFKLKAGISSDIVRQVEYWFSQFWSSASL
jgi:hypothetical protein